MGLFVKDSTSERTSRKLIKVSVLSERDIDWNCRFNHLDNQPELIAAGPERVDRVVRHD